jgi:hypothetical protein
MVLFRIYGVLGQFFLWEQQESCPNFYLKRKGVKQKATRPKKQGPKSEKQRPTQAITE